MLSRTNNNNNCKRRITNRKISSINFLFVLFSTTIIFFLCNLIDTVSSFSTKAASVTSNSNNPRHFIGFDLGTSGARISIIEDNNDDGNKADKNSYLEVYAHGIPWDSISTVTDEKKATTQQEQIGSYDDPTAWMKAIEVLLQGAALGLQKNQLEQNIKNDEHKKASTNEASSSIPALGSVKSICVSGTSASILMVDTKKVSNQGMVTRRPRMYNYDILSSPSLSCKEASTPEEDSSLFAIQAIELLDKFAPDKHTAKSATSSLAKLLSWNAETAVTKSESLCHQSDYVAMKLMSNINKVCGSGGDPVWHGGVRSDWHNCLKLGYDVQKRQWPSWLLELLNSVGMNPDNNLPTNVVSPGAPMGTVSHDVAKQFGFAADTIIVGGTTDSNAAFFAAAAAVDGTMGDGEKIMGTAVTSLGSTLAIKQLSRTYVEDADRGVYSHRFPSVFFRRTDDGENNDINNNEAWLVGGASNVGCAILRQESFSKEELVELSAEIDPMTDSPLQYYPLTKKGERFPVADSNKQPILLPTPNTRKEYLHGILQGISNVENDGYQALGNLGANPGQPTIVLTCGGGSNNDMWRSMRQRIINQAFSGPAFAIDDDATTTKEKISIMTVKVKKAANTEASYGAAILAAATFVNKT